jgi:azurin
MRSKKFIITGAVVAAVAMCGPLTAFAASKKASASPSPSPAAKPSPSASASGSTAEKMRALPFHGVAASVDQSAKTFTIQGKTNARVFKVTDKTTVTKAGAAATLADLNANDAVSGSYWKHADGSLEAKTLKVGGAGDSSPKSDKKAKKDASAEASPAASPSASPKK